MRIVMLLVFLLIVSGCAALPACPRADVRVMDTPSGPLFIFDLPNMEKLAGRMQQIQARSCDPEAEPASSPAAAPVAPKPAAVPLPAPSREPFRHELRPA